MNVPMPTNPLVKISPANSTNEDGLDRPAFTLAYQFTTPPPAAIEIASAHVAKLQFWGSFSGTDENSFRFITYRP